MLSPDDTRLWKPSLTVLHTSVDLPGESVSAYQGCNRISGLCVCVYTLSPQGNGVFCSQVWVRMYCSMIPPLFYACYCFLPGQIPKLIPMCCSG